ncbi:MAG: phage tail tape measure protein [Proteobacteria bacterium]|nr:phage tail tape measure protein [Pseudomonadota bacterium]
MADTELKILIRAKDEASKVMKKIGGSVDAMAGVAVGAMVALGAASTKAFLEYDEGLKTIRKGTGATGKDLEAMGKTMNDVYKQVPQDIDQVATAVADVNTRMGLTGKELDAMSKKMLDFSRITDQEVGASVQEVSRLFGDWSVDTQNQAEAMDFLWKTAQSTGATTSQLAKGVVDYGATLRSLGFDMEQSIAMLGKWEKEGVNTEVMLGGLKIGLKSFASEGLNAADAMQETIDKIAGMEDPAEATSLAMKLFGARAGTDMAMAIREGRFEIDELMAAINESGETVTQAAIDAMTAGERWQVAMNRINVAIQPIGKELVNAFLEAMPYIEEALALLEPMVSDTISEIKEFLSKGEAGMALADMIYDENGIQSASENFKAVIEVTNANIITLVETWAAYLGSVHTTAVGNVVTIHENMGTMLIDAHNRAWVSIIQAVQSEWAEFKQISQSGVDAIVAIFRRMGSRIAQVIRDGIGKARAAFSREIDAMKAKAKSLYHDLVGGSIFPDMVSEIGVWMDEKFDEKAVQPYLGHLSDIEKATYETQQNMAGGGGDDLDALWTSPMMTEETIDWTAYEENLARQIEITESHFGEMAEITGTSIEFIEDAFGTMAVGITDAFADSLAQMVMDGKANGKQLVAVLGGLVGQLASMFGDYYILKGIAIAADPTTPFWTPAAWNLIAQGTALKAFGAIISAASSGAGAGTSGGKMKKAPPGAGAGELPPDRTASITIDFDSLDPDALVRPAEFTRIIIDEMQDAAFNNVDVTLQ